MDFSILFEQTIEGKSDSDKSESVPAFNKILIILTSEILASYTKSIFLATDLTGLQSAT
jgi:hypothetical protein